MSGHVGIDYRRPRGRNGGALATVDSSKATQPRERAAGDFYTEPEWAVEGLMDVQRFAGGIYDPAAGEGTIPRVFQRHGFAVTASDLHLRGGNSLIGDFLAFNEPVDNVVCNPPFALASQFIHRGLRVARFKVAMLLRLSFLEGGAKDPLRAWALDEAPLAAVHPFAARVSMPPGGRGLIAKGGAVAFCWLVWDHDHQGPPVMRRILRRPT